MTIKEFFLEPVEGTQRERLLQTFPQLEECMQKRGISLEDELDMNNQHQAFLAFDAFEEFILLREEVLTVEAYLRKTPNFSYEEVTGFLEKLKPDLEAEGLQLNTIFSTGDGEIMNKIMKVLLKCWGLWP